MPRSTECKHLLKDAAWNLLQDRICLRNSLGGGSRTFFSSKSINDRWGFQNDALVLRTFDTFEKHSTWKLYGKDQELIQSSTTPDPGYQWESNKLTVRHHKRELRSQDNLKIYYSSASATVLSKGTEPRWKNASWIVSSIAKCLPIWFLASPDIELVNISTWKCMEFDQSPGCDITNGTLTYLISVLILETCWYMSKTV